jgi:predicted GNAT family acetyltransferase
MAAKNNISKQRYEAHGGDSLIGLAACQLRGEAVVFTHAAVNPEQKGKRYGSDLARQALDHARRQKRKVVPACAFIARHIEEHPEYQDLLQEQG